MKYFLETNNQMPNFSSKQRIRQRSLHKPQGHDTVECIYTSG